MFAIKSWNKAYVFLIPLVIIAAFFQVAFLQYTLKFDMTEQFLPWRFYVGECLQNHQLPIWNPYSMMGYPVCADPQGSAWYPIAWFFGYFFGYNYSVMNIEFVLHLFIAAWGMWTFSGKMGARKETAAILSLAWACSGLMVGNAQHMSWIVSAAWLPWAFYAYDCLLREFSLKSSLLFALIIFMMLSGGYAAVLFILLYIFLAGFIYYSIQHRKKIKIPKAAMMLTLTVIVILLLSCVILIPVLMHNTSSMRGGPVELSVAMSNPFTFSSLVTFFFPSVSSGNSTLFNTDQSMANAYIGLITILFAIISFVKYYKERKVVLWGILALISWLAALGPEFFLREFLYDYIPLMKLFRHPSVFRIFLMFSLLMIAMPAFNDLFSGRLLVKDLKISFPLFVLLTLISFFWIYTKEGLNLSEFKRQIYYDTAIVCAAAIVFWKREKISIELFGIIFFLLFSADMVVATQRNMQWTVRSNEKVKEHDRLLEKLPKGFVLTNDTLVSSDYNPEHLSGWRNANIYYKKVAYDGYNPFISKSQFERIYRSDEKELKRPLFYFDGNVSGKIDSLTASAYGISCRVYADTTVQLKVQQSDSPLLKVYIDGERQTVYPGIGPVSLRVPAGTHRISFEYKDDIIVKAFTISASAFSLAIVLLIVFRIKQKKL